MSYKLSFKQEAKKEWDNLNHSIKLVFIKKLEERLKDPHVKSSILRQLKIVIRSNLGVQVIA